MDKTDLHQLIEKLPKSQVPTVGTFIGYVIAQSSPEELSDEAHENAPPDDEEYSEEELESFKEGLEELRLGKTISHEEIKRRYNVA